MVVRVAARVAIKFLVEVVGEGAGMRGGTGRGDVFDCDVDGGGDDAGEGVVVEGVEEAFELVPAMVDDEPGFDVDCEGEEDGNPNLAVSRLVFGSRSRNMAYHTIP